MVYTCSIDTPLGMITAAAENAALTGLWFVGQKYYPAGTAGWIRDSDYPVFATLRRHLADYFSGRDRRNCWPDLPLAPAGTPFRQAVWDLLLKIPFGQVTTYGEIAGCLARNWGLSSMSAQAVGGAVGHNPISLLIPCHRVVGSDRSLTGYAGGLDKKQSLLLLEQADLTNDYFRFANAVTK
jgi:methylated-DNA-[protein]-cysteine S-methyltransferase